MEQQAVGVLLGAGSLLVGYLMSKLAESQGSEVDYLRNVPKYRNLGSLKSDLSKTPSNRADVLIEGIVRQGHTSIRSEAAGVSGAAKLVTTTDYVKVYNSETAQWNRHSSTTENSRVSVPFRVVDQAGGSVVVESVHQAGGFRSLLQQVYKDHIKPNQRSIGDFATAITVNETPDGSLKRELMLVFGSSFAGYGQAMLMQQSELKTDVVFFPSEVSTSIRALISRREMVASGLRFVSLLLLVGGGALILFASLPLLRRMLYPKSSRKRTKRAIEQR